MKDHDQDTFDLALLLRKAPDEIDALSYLDSLMLLGTHAQNTSCRKCDAALASARAQ